MLMTGLNGNVYSDSNSFAIEFPSYHGNVMTNDGYYTASLINASGDVKIRINYKLGSGLPLFQITQNGINIIGVSNYDLPVQIASDNSIYTNIKPFNI